MDSSKHYRIMKNGINQYKIQWRIFWQWTDHGYQWTGTDWRTYVYDTQEQAHAEAKAVIRDRTRHSWTQVWP